MELNLKKMRYTGGQKVFYFEFEKDGKTFNGTFWVFENDVGGVKTFNFDIADVNTDLEPDAKAVLLAELVRRV